MNVPPPEPPRALQLPGQWQWFRQGSARPILVLHIPSLHFIHRMYPIDHVPSFHVPRSIARPKSPKSPVFYACMYIFGFSLRWHDAACTQYIFLYLFYLPTSHETATWIVCTGANTSHGESEMSCKSRECQVKRTGESHTENPAIESPASIKIKVKSSIDPIPSSHPPYPETGT